MSKKRFEIWQEWKLKQLDLDLKELVENLAGEGLGQSGIRNQKEEYLVEKCKAEIAMEKAAMEAEEFEEREKIRERSGLIHTNWTIAIATIATVIISTFFNILFLGQQRKTENIQFRAYVQTVDSNFKISDNSGVMTFNLKNTGLTPAIIISRHIYFMIGGQKFAEATVSNQTNLGPNQTNEEQFNFTSADLVKNISHYSSNYLFVEFNYEDYQSHKHQLTEKFQVTQNQFGLDGFATIYENGN